MFKLLKSPVTWFVAPESKVPRNIWSMVRGNIYLRLGSWTSMGNIGSRIVLSLAIKALLQVVTVGSTVICATTNLSGTVR